MHELNVTRNIIEIACDKARENSAQKVTQIKVAAGSLSGIEPECVQFYFEIIRCDYGLAEAQLIIQKIPARFKCRSCALEFESDTMLWQCTKCQGYNIEILSGSDCYIESIEVEA